MTNQTLKLGMKVQVHEIILSNGVEEPPTYRWNSAYTLEGIIDGVAVVKHLGKGLYEGCLVNYALSDVRPAV